MSAVQLVIASLCVLPDAGAVVPRSTLAYSVSAEQDPTPILSAIQNKTSWLQVFNPTYVAATPNTNNRSGLLVRSQNCSTTPPTCSGTGQHASWLTFAELEEDTGDATRTPQVSNFVGAEDAVFGPFDCPNGTQSGEHCPDAFGTEDPRLTYDPESGKYWLMYNAWDGSSVSISLASTTDPTRREGWERHGEIFPNAGLGSYKSGSIVLRPAPEEHFVIWGCSHELRITPSISRSLMAWNYSASKTLLAVRQEPFWDTGFVESAMPPLPLSTGDLLFFYDSMGSWSGRWGFQSGWAILSGSDPTVVLARATQPPIPYTLPWEIGTEPWPVNTANVANLGGGYAIPPDADGNDRFRVYFGGADAVLGAAVVTVSAVPAESPFDCSRDEAGLGQCVPAAHGTAGNFSSYRACEDACAVPSSGRANVV